jgi:hypothetical protein
LLEGKEGVDDVNDGGGGKRKSNPEMMDKGRKLLTRDRQLTFGRMTIKAYVNNESIRTIITGELDRRKMCAKFVPRRLRDEKKLRFHGNKHKTLNQQMHYYYYYYFLLDITYHPCKPVQHVSIPSWDHHQGQF